MKTSHFSYTYMASGKCIQMRNSVILLTLNLEKNNKTKPLFYIRTKQVTKYYVVDYILTFFAQKLEDSAYFTLRPDRKLEDDTFVAESMLANSYIKKLSIVLRNSTPHM